MKKVFITLSLFLLACPVAAQDNRAYSTCNKAANQLASRLSQDNIEAVELPHNFMRSPTVHVALPQRKQLEENSPTERQYSYVVHFVGKRSVDLMASPVLLGSLANTWFSHCPDAATLIFAVYGSGYSTTFGVNQDGSITQWRCAEDLGYIPGRGGNNVKFPNWGYDICSI